MKFREGQQIWVCADLGGQLFRQKGIVLSVTHTEIRAGSFDTPTKPMAEYVFDAEGKSENVWLENRL